MELQARQEQYFLTRKKFYFFQTSLNRCQTETHKHKSTKEHENAILKNIFA